MLKQGINGLYCIKEEKKVYKRGLIEQSLYALCVVYVSIF